MPVRRLVGVPPRRTGPTGAASPVGPDRARTPRCFGARLLLRGFQGGDLLRQSLGTVSGVVVVRLDRRCRAHEQPCGTHPALGRALAEERLWLPQRGGVSVCGADVDRGPNPAVAETSGAGLPVSRDRGASIRPARPAITGPGRGVNGYDQRSDNLPTSCPVSGIQSLPYTLGILFEAAQNRLLPFRLGALFGQGGRLRLQLRQSLPCSAMSRLKLCLLQVSFLVEIQHPGDAAPQLEDLLGDLVETTGLLGRCLVLLTLVLFLNPRGIGQQ